MDRRSWVLLAIAATQGRPISPVQLQKSLFLLDRNFPEQVGDLFHFRPYNYGPFDGNIYTDAERLAADGLVEMEYGEGRSWPIYMATPDGAAAASRILPHADSQAAKYLSTAVQWASSRSFGQLLRAIYAKYPDYATNSVFREQV